MNAFAKVAMQPVVLRTCKGTVNGADFEAGLVELSEAPYPPPHGEAHVMLATQRDAEDYTTKELKVSFSKDKKNGSYGLFADAYTVRVLYIDSSVPAKPVVYTQYQGIARVEYDNSTATFSGTISAALENWDENVRKTVSIKVDFEANPPVRIRRNPRRPSSPAARC